MGRKDGGHMHSEFMTVPVIEAYLRAELEAGHLDAAFDMYERLLRRKRTPHQTVCTTLLQLTITQQPRRALWVLETMSEYRGLDVDDYTRIVRLFIMQRPEREKLEKFHEIGLDILTFADEGQHAYFAHLTSLLDLELHEQVAERGTAAQDLDVSLITHQRQTEAVATLCKRGSMATPQFHLLMGGMGGREGAQSVDELRQLASASVGLANAEGLQKGAPPPLASLPAPRCARARTSRAHPCAHPHPRAPTDEHPAPPAARDELQRLGLNPSQCLAADACLDRRLTLVQGPPGTGKTSVAVQVRPRAASPPRPSAARLERSPRHG